MFNDEEKDYKIKYNKENKSYHLYSNQNCISPCKPHTTKLLLTTKNTCQIIFFSTFITISERLRIIYYR